MNFSTENDCVRKVISIMTPLSIIFTESNIWLNILLQSRNSNFTSLCRLKSNAPDGKSGRQKLLEEK